MPSSSSRRHRPVRRSLRVWLGGAHRRNAEQGPGGLVDVGTAVGLVRPDHGSDSAYGTCSVHRDAAMRRPLCVLAHKIYQQATRSSIDASNGLAYQQDLRTSLAGVSLGLVHWVGWVVLTARRRSPHLRPRRHPIAARVWRASTPGAHVSLYSSPDCAPHPPPHDRPPDHQRLQHQREGYRAQRHRAGHHPAAPAVPEAPDPLSGPYALPLFHDDPATC